MARGAEAEANLGERGGRWPFALPHPSTPLTSEPPPIRVGVSRVSQLTGYTDIWYYDVVITAEMLPAFTYRIYSTLNTAVSVNQPQVRPPPSERCWRACVPLRVSVGIHRSTEWRWVRVGRGNGG